MVHVPEEAQSAGGNYLKAAHLSELRITRVVITGEGAVQESTFTDKETGEETTKVKLVVPIRYDGQRTTGDPTQWAIAGPAAKKLSNIWGDDSAEYVGKTVEVTVGGQGKMQYVEVDELRTRDTNEGKTGKQEALKS